MSENVKRRKKKQRFFFDYTILFIVLFLLMFGMVMLYSTSSYEATVKFKDAAYYFRKQAIASVLGIVAMLAMMLIDYHFVRKFATFAYVASFILIMLVMTPLGYEAGGARRWLKLFGVSLQPAEVAKLALIIFFAALVCKVGDAINTQRGFWTVLGFAVPHAFVVYKVTENLSSAIIILCIVVMMIFVSTPNYKEYFAIAGVVIVFAIGMIALVKYDILPSNISFRLARIKAWLDPEAYAADKGFQTLQALYAIGSGDFFGKGLGESIQKLGFLPEAQNDMIFSIICEELGLFGAIAILLLFMLLTWRFMVVASNAPDMFGALLVVGVMAHISIQVILNIAVVTNTIPNTGITLPFISYGGSSIVFLLAEMGLVLSVSRGIKIEDN